MIIRKATLDDLDQIEIIENECFVDPYKREDLIYELTANPCSTVLVAIIDDKIVGFIDYMITFTSSTISQIAVTKEYRKQNIATELLLAMEKTFPNDIDDQVETITLEVRKSNLAAQNLYRKNGYIDITIKKAYYRNGEDALYMLKRLI